MLSSSEILDKLLQALSDLFVKSDSTSLMGNVRIKQSGLWEPSLLAEQPRLSAHLGPGVYWAGDGCGRDAGT